MKPEQVVRKVTKLVKDNWVPLAGDVLLVLYFRHLLKKQAEQLPVIPQVPPHVQQ